jgi:antitoxin ParD1/3/4
MPTRNVVLTDHHEGSSTGWRSPAIIRRQRGPARGPAADRAARGPQEAAKLEALREAAQLGFADLQAGRFLDFVSFDELEDHLTRATEDALKAKPL